jgi:hypothetical protein
MNDNAVCDINFIDETGDVDTDVVAAVATRLRRGSTSFVSSARDRSADLIFWSGSRHDARRFLRFWRALTGTPIFILYQ